MKNKEELYNEIIQLLQHGNLSTDSIAERLNDGRVYELLSGELSDVISWLPVSKEDRLLHVNGGCGVVTGYLAGRAGEVDVLVYDKRELDINKLVTRNHKNIEYLESLDETRDRIYDAVLIYDLPQELFKGNMKNAYEEILEYTHTHLSENGSIYLIFENRFGVQNWKGRGSNDGYFSSLTGNSRDYISYSDIAEILNRMGIDFERYYPYPNHLFTRVIFSDNRLPTRGDLKNDLRCNFEYDDLELFDEVLILENMTRQGQFPFFSNSYLLVAGEAAKAEDKVVYIKYANDRESAFRISTEIVDKANGMCVRKRAINSRALEHVNNLVPIEQGLSKRFEGMNVSVVPSIMVEDYAESPLVKGVTLESIVEEMVENNDEEGVQSLIDRYIDVLYAGCKQEKFEPSERFVKIFGDVLPEGYYRVSPITDLDFNFDNILVDESWNIIDYEWSFSFPIPQEYVLFRAILYWDRASGGRTLKSFRQWMEYLGISEKTESAFFEMERNFQRYVSGKDNSLARMANRYKKNTIRIDDILEGERRVGELENEKSKLAQIIVKDEQKLAKKAPKFKEKKLGVIGSLDVLKVSEGVIYARGWAFIPDFPYNDSNKTFLVVKSKSTGGQFVIGELDKSMRIDISEQFGDQLGILYSGVVGQFNYSLSEDIEQLTWGIEIENMHLKKEKLIWF